MNKQQEEYSIAVLSDNICDRLGDDIELIDCARMIIKAAVNAGIPEIELRKALIELYGE